MQIKITKRCVIPDRITVYERDRNSFNLVFEVDKINDGLDLTELVAFMPIERENGVKDRLFLEKKITENSVYFYLKNATRLTAESGLTEAQISFESIDKSVLYSTEKFYILVESSIDGNADFNESVTSVIEEFESRIVSSTLACENATDKINETEQELDGKISLVNGRVQNLEETVQHNKTEVENSISELSTDIDGRIDLAVNETSENLTNLVLERENSVKGEMTVGFENFNGRINDLNGLINYVNDSSVKSVNGKSGNVVLSYLDVGAMPSGTQIPTALKCPEPLIINGKTYDGSTKVTVNVTGGGSSSQKSEETVNGETGNIALENEKTFIVNVTKNLYIKTDGFCDNESSACTLIFTYNDNVKIYYSNDIIFIGEDTFNGEFSPKQKTYKIEFTYYTGDGSVTANVSVISCDYKQCVVYEGQELSFQGDRKTTYEYGIKGNINWPEDAQNDPSQNCVDITGAELGVGDLVTNKSSEFYGKYKVSLRSKTANLLHLSTFKNDISGCKLKYENDTTAIVFNGKVSYASSVTVELSKQLTANKTYTISLFRLGGEIENLTNKTSNLIQISFLTGSVVLGSVAINGNDDNVLIGSYKRTFTSNSNSNKMRISMLSGVSGLTFNNYKLGITVTEGDTGVENYIEYGDEIVNFYLDEPLRKVGEVYDEIDMKTGSVIRRIEPLILTSKSQLKCNSVESEVDLPWGIYAGEDKQGFSEDKKINISKYPYLKLYGANDDFVSYSFSVNENQIVFMHFVFGMYEDISEDIFPLYMLYVLKNPKITKLEYKTPLQLFEGETKVAVETNIKASSCFVKTRND